MSPEDHPEKEIKMTSVIRALETADDIELPMDPAFFDRLHDEIMAKVDKTEIKDVPVWQLLLMRPKMYFKTNWKLLFTTGLSLSAAGFLGLQISLQVSSWIPESHTFKVAQNEQELLQKALGSVENFSRTTINYQTQEDFLVDVASQSFEMSQDQFNTIMSDVN